MDLTEEFSFLYKLGLSIAVLENILRNLIEVLGSLFYLSLTYS
jgi:hypothetical protein